MRDCGYKPVTVAYAHTEGNYVPSNLFETMQAGDKAALLLVHFGTTHDDTRALTIDAINEKARAAFPELEFREAYTSRIVMNRLAKRGVYKKNPVEAWRNSRPTVIHTFSYNRLTSSTGLKWSLSVKTLPDERSLQGYPSGYASFVCSRRLPESRFDPGRKRKEKTITLLVGHGTYTPATAQYAMLDYMLEAEGHPDFAVTTVEGYPTLDDALHKIREQKKIKQIQLLPFMFVAGDHAKNVLLRAE